MQVFDIRRFEPLAIEITALHQYAECCAFQGFSFETRIFSSVCQRCSNVQTFKHGQCVFSQENYSYEKVLVLSPYVCSFDATVCLQLCNFIVKLRENLLTDSFAFYPLTTGSILLKQCVFSWFC